MEINQYDITMATHYDITIGNNVARDAHCEITIGNVVARDIQVMLLLCVHIMASKWIITLL